jgi:hypothetical protein
MELIYGGNRLDDVQEHFHKGTLTKEVEDEILEKARKEEYFCPETLYSERVFADHLQYVTCTHSSSLESCIRRCVERGFVTQLLLVFENLDYLLSICANSAPLEKILPLRKCDPFAYTIAKDHGFVDAELEKRVVMIQRLFRKQPLPDPTPFTGISPEDAFGDKYDREPGRYWGYRDAMYYLRWNRRKRVHFLKLVKNYWYGDCRECAYVELIENGNGSVITKAFEDYSGQGWSDRTPAKPRKNGNSDKKKKPKKYPFTY